MRASFLIVVACIDLGGSYYDQTSLSSVLSAFEARLTVPRSKEAEQSANQSGLGPTTLTASATRGSADVSTEDTSAADTKMPADVSTVSTESAVTRGSTEVAATSNPTFMSDSIGEESPTSSEGLLQEHEVGQVEDTLPSAALPSHLATNSGSSRIWTYKEVSLVAHVGQVMWLTVLTGISFHFIGATAHLWHAVYDLRRARA